MKSSLGYVSTTNSSDGKVANEDFPKSKLAKTPLGALYAALLEENVWSQDYDVYASFGGETPFLAISHKSFRYSEAGTRNFLIRLRDDNTAPNTHEVAMMVLENFKDHKQAISSVVADLENTKRDVESGNAKVLFGLARLAILAAFPGAVLGEENTSSAMKIFWFENQMNRELFAVKIEDLRKPSKEASVYHLTGHDFSDFKAKIYISQYSAEQILDRVIGIKN